MSRQPPDLILSGVPIHGSDRASGNALAVSGSKISEIGDAAEVTATAGPTTRVIDLQEGSVVPGLVDAHAHLDREGLKSVLPSLDGATTTDDVLERIAALVSETEPGEWITTMPIGGSPDYEDVSWFAANGYPTRRDLDRVAPDNPVYVKPVWGYWRQGQSLVSVANTAALEAAGITAQTSPPDERVDIVTDDSGLPNGQFLEHTTMPIVELTLMAAAPGFNDSVRSAALVRSMGHAHRTGTTGVVEGHGVSQRILRMYDAHATAGTLTVRTHLAHSPSWSNVPQFESTRNGLLSTGGFFASIDENRHEWVRAPAAPRTGWAGFNYDAGLPRSELKDVLVEAARSGLQVSCLDPAVVDVFEEVHKEVPIDGLRWSWHHISIMNGADIDRAARLGLVVVAHTHRHIADIGSEHLLRVGPRREHEILPLRSLLDAGVPVAFETDNFPATMLPTIGHAVTRRDDSTGEVVGESQAISRTEALRSASQVGAYLAGRDDEVGTLDVGMEADMVVLDQDLLSVTDLELASLSVQLAVVGGRIVYDGRLS